MLDAWTHIFPQAYFAKLNTVSNASGPLKRWMTLRSLYDLDERFRLMDQFCGYKQILTPSMPAFDEIADPSEAQTLARLMNDGLAALVAQYPDRFPYFVAGVSLMNAKAACSEIQRALDMGAIGFQLPSHVQGIPLDDPRNSSPYGTPLPHRGVRFGYTRSAVRYPTIQPRRSRNTKSGGASAGLMKPQLRCRDWFSPVCSTAIHTFEF